jgi:hypothetical protein
MKETLSKIPKLYRQGKAESKIYPYTGMKKPRLEMVDYSLETPLTVEDTAKVFKTYQKKMVKRMRDFLIEARRMDKKFIHVLEKLNELGVTVDSLGVSALSSEQILNKRRRARSAQLTIDAHKGDMKLRGSIVMTPASIRLQLDSDKYYGTVYAMTYYKTLVVKDFYLVAMVKYEKRDSRHDFI